jgi:hypothetical protein
MQVSMDILYKTGFTFKNPHFISISILTCINYLQDAEFVEYDKGRRGKAINKRN